MSNIKPAYAIAKEVCEDKKADPILLIHALLRALEHFHTSNAGFRVGPDQAIKANVFNDITALVNCSYQKAVPVSLLAALDLALESQQHMDAHNSKVYGDTPAGRTLAKEAEASKTLRLILREFMNQLENRGLQQRLAFEELNHRDREGGDEPK